MAAEVPGGLTPRSEIGAFDGFRLCRKPEHNSEGERIGSAWVVQAHNLGRNQEHLNKQVYNSYRHWEIPLGLELCEVPGSEQILMGENARRYKLLSALLDYMNTGGKLADLQGMLKGLAQLQSTCSVVIPDSYRYVIHTEACEGHYQSYLDTRDDTVLVVHPEQDVRRYTMQEFTEIYWRESE